jgi:hypothetical protein
VDRLFGRLRVQIHEEGMAILRDAGRARSRSAMERIGERLRTLTETVEEVAWRCRDRDPEDCGLPLLRRLS